MILLFSFIMMFANASDVPATPPNPCYENCTEYMSDLVNEFNEAGQLPSFIPAVYSGECRHLGPYDPDFTHFAVVMIDQLEDKPNFSTIFSFFAPENEYKNWNVEIARNEMSDYWKKNGAMILEENTARTEIRYDNGGPAYVYWMRQNPITKQLLYVTYAGTSMKSFCRLDKNN